MEKFYPFSDEKFGKKTIFLPSSRGKRDSRPALPPAGQTCGLAAAGLKIRNEPIFSNLSKLEKRHLKLNYDT